MTSLAKYSKMNLEYIAKCTFALNERLMVEVPELSDELYRELQQVNNRILFHDVQYDTALTDKGNDALG